MKKIYSSIQFFKIVETHESYVISSQFSTPLALLYESYVFQSIGNQIKLYFIMLMSSDTVVS